jgi:hypothetical protein
MKPNLLKQVFVLAVLFIVSINSANYVATVTSNEQSRNTPQALKDKGQAALPDFQVASKHFDFQELRAGNCVIAAGNKLDVFSDGHAEFRATVWTNHTHSGDTWHHHMFFKNAAGAVIFRIDLEGPNHMNDDGSRYAFSSNFNFPAAIYNEISFVAVSGDC